MADDKDIRGLDIFLCIFYSVLVITMYVKIIVYIYTLIHFITSISVICDRELQKVKEKIFLQGYDVM